MTNYDLITQAGISCKDRAGDQKVYCPKCRDQRKNKTDKSLSVNVDKGVWRCHNPGCDWAGSVNRKPMKTYNKPEGTADGVSDQVKAFFLNRGISSKTVDEYRVTAGMAYMPQENKEVNALHFNYYRDGELVNIKYRDGKKNFKMVAGAELILYGMDTINNFDYLVITEGEFDAMSFHEVGIQAVSVPNGASSGSQRLEYIDNCIDWLDKFGKIFIATDADAPGQALSAELSRRLGRERCYTVLFPGGCKDANEVLTTMNAQALKDSYYQAKPLPLESVLTVNDVMPGLLTELETGLTPGDKLRSMPNLSEFHTWRSGQFGVITGIPGHGKSSAADNIIVSLASELGWPIGIWSAEKPKVERHIAELYQIYLDKSFYKFNLQYNDTLSINKTDILTHKQFFDDHFYFIDTGTADITVEGLLAKGKELIRRYGIRLLLLDNWATIEHSSNNKNRHEYTGNSLSKMALFCRDNDCDIMLVAHPTKIKEQTGSGSRIPKGYDISDSSHFYNLPDYGFTVYRNKETGQTDLIKWKNRWRELGEEGICHFTYKVQTGKFLPADPVNTGQSPNHFIGQTIKTDAGRFAGM